MTRSAWLALSFLIAAPLAANDDISDDRRQELHNLLIQDCGSCHGLKMRGGLGPALLPDMLQGKSDCSREHRVSRPGDVDQHRAPDSGRSREAG